MRSASSTYYLRWLPALGWMALIFLGSTDALSHEHTSHFVEPFLRWLFRGTLSAGAIENLHHLIRKTGHLTEYAVLCVLYWWALRPSTDARRAGWAILLAACFAGTDEFHQSFVPSRGSSVSDVLIDTVGAALGLALFLAARRVLQAGTGRPPSPPG